jgi:hypothetical protein
VKVKELGDTKRLDFEPSHEEPEGELVATTSESAETA